MSVREVQKERQKPAVISKCLEDFDRRRKVELQCYVLRKRMRESEKREAEIEKAVGDLMAALQGTQKDAPPPGCAGTGAAEAPGGA